MAKVEEVRIWNKASIMESVDSAVEIVPDVLKHKISIVCNH